MITNFEELTHELTSDEKTLLPFLINGFKKRTNQNPVKAPDIIKGVNQNPAKFGLRVKYKFSEVRLRKLCNFIRSEGILPLIASSKGYYVSYDKNEIINQIKSLNERGEAIINSANGLKKFL